MNNSAHQMTLRPQTRATATFVSPSAPLQQCANKYFPHHKQVTFFRPKHLQYLNTKRAHANMISMSTTTAGDGRRRLGVMVSGGGRSVENLCELIDKGKLKRCEIVMMIASKSSVGALERVQRFGITTKVMRPRDYDDSSLFSQAISSVFDDCAVDFIVMAGWMHFYVIPDRYLGRVINIHPSLIPSFCGKGYYGERVHKAVLSFGAKISGCTVHMADNVYDHGPIILQKAVDVLDSDSVDDLAARVFEQEKIALPQAIQLLVDDRIQVQNGVTRIVSPSHTK